MVRMTGRGLRANTRRTAAVSAVMHQVSTGRGATFRGFDQFVPLIGELADLAIDRAGHIRSVVGWLLAVIWLVHATGRRPVVACARARVPWGARPPVTKGPK